MTFRQRIIIAFTIIIVLPMLLFMVSFVVIGNAMARGEDPKHFAQYLDYRSLTDDYQQYSELLDGTRRSSRIWMRTRRSWRIRDICSLSLRESVSVIPILL